MIAVGLMSGTSADGVDAAAVDLPDDGGARGLRLLAHVHRPYDDTLRAAVLDSCTPAGGRVDRLTRLHGLLGEAFAEAALAAVAAAGLAAADVAVIGSHGQTVHHLPPSGDRAGATLQLGAPAVIAERTGVTVVADFRWRDIAAGGHGAPLVAAFDLAYFGGAGERRALLNLGGIANVTWVGPGGASAPTGCASGTAPPGLATVSASATGSDAPAASPGFTPDSATRTRIRRPSDEEPAVSPGFAPDSATGFLATSSPGFPPASATGLPANPSSPGLAPAFDTGPGNALLDAAAALVSGGQLRCDVDGALAARGHEDAGALAELLAHPFLRQRPPRSTGRELWSPSLAAGVRDRWGLGDADLLATLTAFTAESVAAALRGFLPPVDRCIVGGGGRRNPVLMARLRQALAPVPVDLSEEHGLDGGAKEAIAFAWLAQQTLLGRPGNVPAATGARRAVVLGSVTAGASRGM